IVVRSSSSEKELPKIATLDTNGSIEVWDGRTGAFLERIVGEWKGLGVTTLSFSHFYTCLTIKGPYVLTTDISVL
nr:hypothetical protein [Candidatus Dependentiae bacterium]